MLKLKKEHSGSESEISEGHGDGHEIYNQAYYDEVKWVQRIDIMYKFVHIQIKIPKVLLLLEEY